MSERQPHRVRRTSEARKSLAILLASMVTGVAVVSVVKDAGKPETAKSPSAPHAETLAQGKPFGKYGGLLLGSKFNRRIDAISCTGPADSYVNGVKTYSERLDSDIYPDLTDRSQYYTSQIKVANFEGLDNNSEDGTADVYKDNYLYLALRKGWVINYDSNSQTFGLEHFEVEPIVAATGQERITMARMVGQPVASSDLVGLELGTFTNYTDGQTEIKFNVDWRFSTGTLQPAIETTLECAKNTPASVMFVN